MANVRTASVVLKNRSANGAAIGMLVIALLWSGMIVGVSFLATPGKFLAPSLALPVALDVGRHTFEVFNWVEIGWSLGILGLAVLHPPRRWLYTLVGVPCTIVALETAWLLPVLDARVAVIIAGGAPLESNLHFLYIMLEGAKFTALLVLGLWLLSDLAHAARTTAAVA